MQKTIVLLSTAALLTVGASVAMAQEQTPPTSDVRALEPPIDYRPYQDPRLYQGRSAYRRDRSYEVAPLLPLPAPDDRW